MSTSDTRVSPVIDMSRTNMLVTHNMIDRPYKHNSISGSNGSSKNIFAVGGNEVSGYFDEGQNNGTAYSKWISKLFVFDTECDGIEVKISSVLYNHKDVRVYYKVRNSGIDSDFSQVNWTAFNPYNIAPNENRKKIITVKDDFTDVVSPAYLSVDINDYLPTPGLPDNVETIKVRSSVNIDPRNIIAEEWQTLTYSVQDLFKFDAIAIKVVLESDNPALTPLIDDISVICSE